MAAIPAIRIGFTMAFKDHAEIPTEYSNTYRKQIITKPGRDCPMSTIGWKTILIKSTRSKPRVNTVIPKTK